MTVNLTSKIVSVLGNPEAITPLAVKDIMMTLSLTHFAKKEGGNIEGNDRFIDESGTLLIWLGGIPFFKKILDYTLYKAFKQDPAVDVRVLQNQAHRKFAQQHAKGAIKDSFDKAIKNEKLVKNLFYTKFAVATGLTLAAYIGLTKIKQAITRKKTEEKVIKEVAFKKLSQHFIQKNSKLKFAALNKGNNVSFGLTGKGIQAFMFDPALNTSIIDLGILATRLGKSRPGPDDNKKTWLYPERVEYLVKDAFCLTFYYAFAHVFQPIVDKGFRHLFKKPVDLDARALDSKELLESMRDSEKLSQQLETFKKAQTDSEILEFLQKNPDNIVTKVAKISDVVRTLKDSSAIDVRKYIKTEKVKDIGKYIAELSETAKNGGGMKDVEKFMKSARNLKIGSILTGLGICMFAVGYVMPKILYGVVRKNMNNGKTTFHVQECIEKEMKEQLAMQLK